MLFIDKFTPYKIPVIDNGVKLPQFNIEDKYKKQLSLSKDVGDYDFLAALCMVGLNKKVGKDNPKYKEYYARMKEELSVFQELGFCSYLLITWDIVNYCRENQIATGLGRGSSSASLVLYLIDCTKIDSLKYELYFQRFLSKSRAKFKVVDDIKYFSGSLLFDVDLDISFSDRYRLTSWLENKYKGKIAKLLTISTYSTKILIKEVVKSYLEWTETQATELSESVPKIFGKVKNIDDSIEISEDFKEFAKENPEAIALARKIHGLNSHVGVHASAWIISADPIDEIFPLQLTKDKELITAYSMEDSLNLAIKIDILGLRCATLIDQVCKLVNIKIEDIDLNDKFIYDNLQNLQTPHGLFQIEAETNLKIVKHLRPKNLNHLAAVVACARPGGLDFVEDFAQFIKDGTFKSVHPFFDDILQDSAGVPIYQESQLRMLNKIGFSLEESETVRRILGKKKTEEIKEWEQKVKEKVKEKNLPEELGNIVFKVISDSASYSFCKAHALSYGSMTAMTVYLKFKYPKEFFLCLLELTKEEPNPIEQINIIQKELKYFDIKLLAPHILKSGMNFQIENGGIRYPLSAIKNIAGKSIEKLQNFKSDYANKFEIFQGAEEAGLNIMVLCGLIQSGTMDDFLKGQGRCKMVLECQLFNLLTPREKKKIMTMAERYNYDLFQIVLDLSKNADEKGKTFIKDSRLVTIRKYYDKYKEIYYANIKNQNLCNYYFEKELLGYSYSQDLTSILKKTYSDIISIEDVKKKEDRSTVTFGGEILDLNYSKSKKDNKKYLKVIVEDSTSQMNAMVFGDEKIQVNDEANDGKKIEIGNIIMARGQKKGDIVFCNNMIIQKLNIFIKMSEFNKKKKEENLENLVDKTQEKV